jgi:hypothetical protein
MVRQLYQLTYAVAEGGELEAGGWQVKQVSRNVPELYRDLLRRQACVEIESPVPLPAHPTPAELRARPVRFTYRCNEGGGLLCRAVPAGHDATGRPGNVFSHVRMDPELGTANPDADLNRPVDWWPASGWLAPFGAHEVQDARFDDDDVPDIDPGTVRADVLDFLFTPAPGRWEFLGAWLDAVHFATQSGLRVVLGLHNQEDAVRWIAAASHLTSTMDCRRLTFSTFERWPRLLGEPELPLMSVVPASDLPTGSIGLRSGFLLLDPTTPPRGGGPGRNWTTQLGHAYPVTPWSLRTAALRDRGREEAEDLLVRMDLESLGPGRFEHLHDFLTEALALPARATAATGPAAPAPDRMDVASTEDCGAVEDAAGPRPKPGTESGSPAGAAGTTAAQHGAPLRESVPASELSAASAPVSDRVPRPAFEPGPGPAGITVEGPTVAPSGAAVSGREEPGIPPHDPRPADAAGPEPELEQAALRAADRDAASPSEKDPAADEPSGRVDPFWTRPLPPQTDRYESVPSGAGEQGWAAGPDPELEDARVDGAVYRGGRQEVVLPPSSPGGDPASMRPPAQHPPEFGVGEQSWGGPTGSVWASLLLAACSDPPWACSTPHDWIPGDRAAATLSRGLIGATGPKRVGVELAREVQGRLKHLRQRVQVDHWDDRGSLQAVMTLLGAADLAHRVAVRLWGIVGVPRDRAEKAERERLNTEVRSTADVAVELLATTRLDTMEDGVLSGNWPGILLAGAARLDEHFLVSIILPTWYARGQSDGADPLQILIGSRFASYVATFAPPSGAPETPLPVAPWPTAIADRSPEEITEWWLRKDGGGTSFQALRRLGQAVWGDVRADRATGDGRASAALGAVERYFAEAKEVPLRPHLAAFWPYIAALSTTQERSRLSTLFWNVLAGHSRPGRDEPEDLTRELALMREVLGWWMRPKANPSWEDINSRGNLLLQRPELVRSSVLGFALTALDRSVVGPPASESDLCVSQGWANLAKWLRGSDSASLRRDPGARAAMNALLSGSLYNSCCPDRGTHVWHRCLELARTNTIPEGARDDPLFVTLRPDRTWDQQETVAAVALEVFLGDAGFSRQRQQKVHELTARLRTGLSDRQLEAATAFLPRQLGTGSAVEPDLRVDPYASTPRIKRRSM